MKRIKLSTVQRTVSRVALLSEHRETNPIKYKNYHPYYIVYINTHTTRSLPTHTSLAALTHHTLTGQNCTITYSLCVCVCVSFYL